MKQPNEPSPPQQVAYVVQAPTNVRDANQAIKEAYSVKAATVLGVVHIICGIIAFSCEIDLLVWATFLPGTLGTGIWTSVFFFISGGLAIGGAQSGKKCLVMATLIMAIISAVCAGILLIMSALLFRPYVRLYYGYSSNYDNNPYYNVKNTVPSYSLLITMGATMLIVAIISAALTCKPLCCRSDDQRVVNSQPNQVNNQVNQGYNQPNQINNQVGQVHYQPNQETQFHYNQPNMVDPPPYQATQVSNHLKQVEN